MHPEILVNPPSLRKLRYQLSHLPSWQLENVIFPIKSSSLWVQFKSKEGLSFLPLLQALFETLSKIFWESFTSALSLGLLLMFFFPHAPGLDSVLLDGVSHLKESVDEKGMRWEKNMALTKKRSRCSGQKIRQQELHLKCKTIELDQAFFTFFCVFWGF